MTDTDNTSDPFDPEEAAWGSSPDPFNAAEFRFRLMLECGWGNSPDAWRQR